MIAVAAAFLRRLRLAAAVLVHTKVQQAGSQADHQNCSPSSNAYFSTSRERRGARFERSGIITVGWAGDGHEISISESVETECCLRYREVVSLVVHRKISFLKESSPDRNLRIICCFAERLQISVSICPENREEKRGIVRVGGQIRQ